MITKIIKRKKPQDESDRSEVSVTYFLFGIIPIWFVKTILPNGWGIDVKYNV